MMFRKTTQAHAQMPKLVESKDEKAASDSPFVLDCILKPTIQLEFLISYKDDCLLSCDDENVINLWDKRTQQPLHNFKPFKLEDGVTAITHIKENQFAYANHEGEIHLFSINDYGMTQTQLFAPPAQKSSHDNHIYNLFTLSDGTLVSERHDDFSSIYKIWGAKKENQFSASLAFGIAFGAEMENPTPEQAALIDLLFKEKIFLALPDGRGIIPGGNEHEFCILKDRSSFFTTSSPEPESKAEIYKNLFFPDGRQVDIEADSDDELESTKNKREDGWDEHELFKCYAILSNRDAVVSDSNGVLQYWDLMLGKKISMIDIGKGELNSMRSISLLENGSFACLPSKGNEVHIYWSKRTKEYQNFMQKKEENEHDGIKLCTS